MSRPKRIPKAEQFVILQREHEELEAKSLTQGMTVTFLNQENKKLIETNKELNIEIASLKEQLKKTNAFTLEVLNAAEIRQAVEKTLGYGEAISTEVKRLHEAALKPV